MKKIARCRPAAPGKKETKPSEKVAAPPGILELRRNVSDDFESSTKSYLNQFCPPSVFRIRAGLTQTPICSFCHFLAMEW